MFLFLYFCACVCSVYVMVLKIKWEDICINKFEIFFPGIFIFRNSDPNCIHYYEKYNPSQTLVCSFRAEMVLLKKYENGNIKIWMNYVLLASTSLHVSTFREEKQLFIMQAILVNMKLWSYFCNINQISLITLIMYVSVLLMK